MTHLLPSAVLDALIQIDGPTLANAIEAFNVRDRTEGFASLDVRCQIPELKPMVGYAITCTTDSTTPANPRQSRQLELLDAIVAAPKPCVVVMQHIGPDRLRSCMLGDVLSASFQKLGAVGAVTDGGFRDLRGIRKRAPGFQVFAAGMVVSHGTHTIIDINTTVCVGGLMIEPGDLLHGDENGLLKVPFRVAEQVIQQVKTVWEKEQTLIDFVQGDAFTLEGLKHRLSH
ncbi:MAG: RraA family protein [Anaerolineae bacterium]|nr:RraA family protein [Anaerolineae bacterium]